MLLWIIEIVATALVVQLQKIKAFCKLVIVYCFKLVGGSGTLSQKHPSKPLQSLIHFYGENNIFYDLSSRESAGDVVFSKSKQTEKSHHFLGLNSF